MPLLAKLRRSVWRRVGIAVVVALALTMLAGAGLQAGVFEQFQAQVTDRFYPYGETDPRVVVVGADGPSLDQIGEPWPWSRARHAELLRRLDVAGAKVIAYDLLLIDERPDDDQLAAAMGEVDTVLSAQSEGELRRITGKRGRWVMPDVHMPAPKLEAAAIAVGHAQVTPDPFDGVVRTLPLVVDRPDGDLMLSLALATFLRYTGLDREPPTFRPLSIEVGDVTIPTGPQSTLTIHYSDGLRPRGRDVKLVSVGDVFSGAFDAGIFQDAIVLIGATDQSLGDYRLTPVDKENVGLPGVFIHANALNTMLTEQYHGEPSRNVTLLSVFLLSLLIGISGQFLRLRLGVVVFAMSVGLYFLLTSTAFDAGIALNLIYPLLMAVIALMMGLAASYLIEGRSKRRVSALFAQYVPPEVAHQLVDEDRFETAMQGERMDISVLFCDLRGFTALSAKLEPHQVAEMLDIFYLELSRIIIENKGTLMQYVGDEIYAIFGAPLPIPDHAQRAFDCAVAMQAARPRLAEKLDEKGLPPLFYGVGLNTGSAVLAHVGNEFRRQYSAIGDTVNIGSRFCSQAREDHVCLPDHMRDLLTEVPELEDCGEVEFKNATRPIRVWRLSPHGRGGVRVEGEDRRLADRRKSQERRVGDAPTSRSRAKAARRPNGRRSPDVVEIESADP